MGLQLRASRQTHPVVAGTRVCWMPLLLCMHLYLEAGRGGINAQRQQVCCADDQVFTPALGGGGSVKRESHHLSRRMAVQ